MLENNSHFLWQSAHDNPYLDEMKMAETITVHALFGKAVLQDIAIDQLHSSAYQPTEQLGFPMKVTINKNEAGSFRIPFHNREQMQNILEKLCCHSKPVEAQE